MVWGAISFAGKSELLVLHGHVNSEVYQETLKRGLLPFMRTHHPNGSTFMQDNAPVHTSRATKAFLDEKRVQTLDWPANSPDLNPIENLWALMKKRLTDMVIKTPVELEAALRRIWREIPLETVQSLINSRPPALEGLS